MASPLVETSFLVPVRGDVDLSNGQFHRMDKWNRLDYELTMQFGGYTLSPGDYRGVWRDPKTGVTTADESRRYVVAVEESRIAELKDLLGILAIVFHQKCIYLSIAGRVEFVEPPNEIDQQKLHRFGRKRD